MTSVIWVLNVIHLNMVYMYTNILYFSSSKIMKPTQYGNIVCNHRVLFAVLLFSGFSKVFSDCSMRMRIDTTHRVTFKIIIYQSCIKFDSCTDFKE